MESEFTRRSDPVTDLHFFAETTGKDPTWNFWKYLVDPNGHVINAWGPWISVDSVYPDIVSAVRRARGQRHGGDL